METKKAIIWVRTSTTKQHTTDAQREQVQQMAIADGYTEKQLIYIGREGASATKVDAAYTADIESMYNYFRSGTVGCVYAWAVDRIARDLTASTRFNYMCREYGVNLRTVEGVGLTADGGVSIDDVILPLKQWIAAEEMIKKNARVALTKSRHAKEGKFNGGFVLFGYRLNAAKQYVPDPETAPIVARMFDLYATGKHTLTTLHKELAKMGVQKRAMNIRAMLVNTTYIGYTERHVNGETIRIETPALVERSVFERCKEVAKRNNLRADKSTKRYLFGAGVLVCPVCGKSFYGGVYNYQDITRNITGVTSPSGEKCTNASSPRIDYVDSLLYHVARRVAWDRQIAQTSVDRENIEATIEQLKKEIEANRVAIEKAADRKKRVAMIYADGVIDESEYKAKINAITREITGYTNEITKTERRISALRGEARNANMFAYNFAEDQLNEPQMKQTVKDTIEVCYISHDDTYKGTRLEVHTVTGEVLTYNINGHKRTDKISRVTAEGLVAENVAMLERTAEGMKVNGEFPLLVHNSATGETQIAIAI